LLVVVFFFFYHSETAFQEPMGRLTGKPVYICL
jgi:hypothetical protein